MQLEFARPWALILLPVLAGIIIGLSIWDLRSGRKDHRKRSLGHRRGRSRRAGEIVLRCLVAALAVLAVSGASIRKSSDMTTTVFLMDLSDSMKGSVGDEVSFVQSAIAAMPSGNQAGIVVFGEDARIEQFVSEKKAFTDIQSKVTATATNLQQAVQTAMALFPDDTAKRLVLLTDGVENEGSLADLAVSYANSDIELKVVEYDSSVEEEVYVSSVELPETISEGDQFEVQVEVYATEATKATVSLYSGRTLKGQKEVLLQKGSNNLVFSDQGVENGLKSYRVTVEAEKDTVTVNNTYSAFTMVEAPPKILVVEGEKDESREFVKLLEACNYDYEVVTPSGVPGSISDMLRYQTVILLDVYADDLRSAFLDTLESYVKDYAGGFIVIGGPNSYALGNYRDTAIETVLPVKMDLEGEKEVPKLAMAMVIDHSGSMDSPSTERSSITCMEVAKQAAVNALDSLREIDEVGVLAFDDTYTWSVPMQEVVDPAAIQQRISGITADGGTSIYPALQEAAKALEESDAVLKHIVLLTDGQDGYHAYQPLLDEMEENGITLSTVAVGMGADSGTLQWLAEEGGGRYYYSDAGTALPRIFAQEVYLSAKSYLINEEFTPVIVNSHEIIRNIFTEGSPSLLGYIATTEKSTSTVILESEREDPLLAVWQYGLGRTAAWTSDGTNEWTGNFAGWENYASLWRNLIDWTISDTELGNDTISMEQQASSAVITYQTEDYSSGTSVSAVITDEDGNQQEAELKATAPGVYQATVDLNETGVYSVNLRNQNGEEIVKNFNTATALQYSQEYRYGEVSGSLGSFVNQVGGRYIEKAEEVFDSMLKGAVSRKDLTGWLMLAAVLLFVVDVIFRRMHVDWMLAILRGADGLSRRAKEAFQRKKERTDQSVRREEKTPQAEDTAAAAATEPPAGWEKQKKEGKGAEQKKTAQKKAEQKKKKAAVNTENAVIDAAALLKKKKERDL